MQHTERGSCDGDSAKDSRDHLASPAAAKMAVGQFVALRRPATLHAPCSKTQLLLANRNLADDHDLDRQPSSDTWPR